MIFELKVDHKGEFRWHLRAPNGKIVADSGEGYKNKQDCCDEIGRIRRDVPSAGFHDKTGTPPCLPTP
jgi:uncharacterized protein